MAKATIKAVSGALITVEGSKKEVADIISHYEKTTTIEKDRSAIKRTRTVQKEEKKRLSANDLILELKADGFFDSKKGLGDIASAIEEKGHLYPVTTLSGVVISLVKKHILSRKKVEGRWMYGK